MLTRRQGFGGGILANQQSKDITEFYDLQPRCDTPLNVFAHNSTTIRNLAEILHRETVPLVETQYAPQEPMVMSAVSPVSAAAGKIPNVLADLKDIKKPTALTPSAFTKENPIVLADLKDDIKKPTALSPSAFIKEKTKGMISGDPASVVPA